MSLDERLIDRIQRDFPLEPRPFAALAGELGADEQDVIGRVKALHETGLVRQIGPVFDLKRLGYVSTLCAAKVASGAVDSVAVNINAFPEVTHNYLRDSEFNMWFTLVAPSDDRIEAILAEIRAVPGVEEVISLPAGHTFKINVHFAAGDAPVGKTGTDTLLGSVKRVSVPAFPTMFSERDIALIRALQAPLPVVERPYAEIAREAGISEEAVIARVREWLDAGVIRRFGARVKHHAMGYTANGMSVWDVPPDKVEAAGQYMAGLSEVSHCYTRPRLSRWPYNLYAMIHGKEKEDVLAVARHISSELGIDAYAVLFSQVELKKSAPVYF